MKKSVKLTSNPDKDQSKRNNNLLIIMKEVIKRRRTEMMMRILETRMTHVHLMIQKVQVSHQILLD
jgi:hypothetical protein